MKKRLDKWKSKTETIVTLGTFDGVHRGHRKLLKEIRKKAKKWGLESLIFTFDQPPKNYLDECLKLILTPEEKFELLEERCDHLVIAHFADIRDLAPEEFVTGILINKLNMKALIVGKNFRFGNQRSGDTDALKKLSQKYGFKLTVVEFEEMDKEPISSTRIRELIGQGQVARAKKLLGYFPKLQGTVISGKERGRSLGFPTLNLAIDKRLVAPEQGIYASYTWLPPYDNKQESIFYTGNRPTFEESDKSYEIYLLGQDLQEDFLDEKISVALVSKIRDDQKFPNSKLLARQINQDAQVAKKILLIKE